MPPLDVGEPAFSVFCEREYHECETCEFARRKISFCLLVTAN